MNPEKTNVSFILNGKKVSCTVSHHTTLLELLRNHFRLTAIKEGCAKGECGACTVFFNEKPINSCLKLAASVSETDSVVTLEGLENDLLMQKIQKSYVEHGAVQCGFCIPGMLINSHFLLSNNPSPSKEEIKKALSGNICRCTGYHKIETAVKKACS